MPQLTYLLNTNPFIAGSIGYSNVSPVAFTYSNPLQPMLPGYGVVLGSGPGLCQLPSNSNQDFVGAIIRDINFPATGLPDSPVTDFSVVTNYPVNSAISVMARGQIQVYVKAPVTSGNSVYLIYKQNSQVQTVVFSADLIVGNVVHGSVNGVALSDTPFNVSNVQTLVDLAAKIAAVSTVFSAVSDGVHTITVTSKADSLTVLSAFSVTGGASQATVVITQTQALVASSDVGKFLPADGSALYGTAVAFQVSPGVRWLEASGADSQGNFVAMLDVNVPGLA